MPKLCEGLEGEGACLSRVFGQGQEAGGSWGDCPEHARERHLPAAWWVAGCWDCSLLTALAVGPACSVEPACSVGPAQDLLLVHWCDVPAPFARDGSTGRELYRQGSLIMGEKKQSHKQEEENGQLLCWLAKAGVSLHSSPRCALMSRTPTYLCPPNPTVLGGEHTQPHTHGHPLHVPSVSPLCWLLVQQPPHTKDSIVPRARRELSPWPSGVPKVPRALLCHGRVKNVLLGSYGHFPRCSSGVECLCYFLFHLCSQGEPVTNRSLVQEQCEYLHPGDRRVSPQGTASVPSSLRKSHKAFVHIVCESLRKGRDYVMAGLGHGLTQQTSYRDNVRAKEDLCQGLCPPAEPGGWILAGD